MQKIIIFFIKLYQIILSPNHGLLRGLFFLGTGCRFYPTCSEYSCRALSQYGLLKGIMVSFRRILKCNPWNTGGYDPL